ncbi:MAG: hypothetical protein P4L99_17750 [Chthoniobacter sp.]|nr:hypothetical protein [Chthoniobacter sp.]
MNEGPGKLTPKSPSLPAPRALLVLGAIGFLYVGSFALDSHCGGYWNQLEQDGYDRWSFGLSLPTAVLWQPRLGYWAPYRSDWLGALYSPLIRLDRRFIHPSRYVTDPKFLEWSKATAVAEWHPTFRAEIQSARQPPSP